MQDIGGQQVLPVAPGLVSTSDRKGGGGWKLMPDSECQIELGYRLKVLRTVGETGRSRRHGLGQVREGAVERISRTLLAKKEQGVHPSTV